MNEQKTNFDTETARDDSDVILDVRNLDVYLNTYSGRIHAVRDVSFTLKKGETLVVVGESGCGKSMTARAIMQLLPEKISEVGERSQILFNGTDILKMPEKKKETELRGKYISMIFQDPTTFLNPTMTVGEQIAESLSQVALAEILGVVLAYALKSLVENLSKNNNWPDKGEKS